MKQTAVEWFFWKLYILKEVQYESIIGLYEQAKEMEKQHLYNFYVQGGVDAIMEADRNVEQYYNETFKSE